MWSCLVAFVSGALAEGVCTKWVQAVASQKPVSAGFLSTAWAASCASYDAQESNPQQKWRSK
jgi:hypothetical protein